VESKARHLSAETKAIHTDDIQVLEQQQSLVSGQSKSRRPTAQDIAIIQYGKTGSLLFSFLVMCLASILLFAAILSRRLEEEIQKKIRQLSLIALEKESLEPPSTNNLILGGDNLNFQTN
jgi:hypothetical protein